MNNSARRATLREGFHQVADSVDFPSFVADFLKSLFDANLSVQHMDQTGGQLVAKGFQQLGQVQGPFERGDIALFGSRIAIYNGGAWTSSTDGAVGLWPPFRIFRYRGLQRR